MKHLKLGIIVFILTVLVSGVAHACYVPPEEIKCDEGYHVVENECVQDEVEVTPTPTETPVEPTPTEAPKEEPKGDNRGDPHTEEAKAPAPVVCTVPFEAPRVWYTKKDGKIFFNWADDASGIQKYSITYGYSKDKLEYGVDNLPSDSRSLEIKGLTHSPVWFQVQAWKDGCQMSSQTIDP